MKLRTFAGYVVIAVMVVLGAALLGQTAQAADKVELKFANFYPPAAKQSKAVEDFIAEFKERLGDKANIRYFAGGSLLQAPGMVKGIESGIVDIGMAHTQYTSGRFPITEALELPLAYPSVWVSSHVANDFYNKFKPKEWDKMQPLWFFTNSPCALITTKPVRTMDDLKGLTIRAPGVLGQIVAALGGTAAPTPMVETYDALSKGVVQGAYVGIEALKTFRFAEVAKFATMAWSTGASYTFFAAMNKKKYESLPTDVRSVLDNLSGEYAERFPLIWNSIDLEGIDAGKKAGVEFIELSDDEMNKWSEKVQPIVEEYVKKMVGQGFKEDDIRAHIAYIKERTKFWTDKQVDYQIKTASGPKYLQQ